MSDFSDFSIDGRIFPTYCLPIGSLDGDDMQHLPASNVIEIPALKSAEKFIVFCGKREPWIDGDAMDRAAVIHQVSTGEYNDLRQIVAFSLQTGTCRDATKDICGTVIERWAQDGKRLTDKEFEFVELAVGISVARAFQREDA